MLMNSDVKSRKSAMTAKRPKWKIGANSKETQTTNSRKSSEEPQKQTVKGGDLVKIVEGTDLNTTTKKIW